MKIDVQNYHTNFGTSYRKVVNKKTWELGACYEASTYFFANGLQWNKFFNEVIEKYKNTPKVNVFSLACSDGSEALSIAMLLLSKLGAKVNKYFPIKAVDFDSEITKLIKSGFINLSAEDEVRINKHTGNKLNTFLERTNKTLLSDEIGSSDKKELLTSFKLKPILSDKIEFITEDLNTYVDKMPSNDNLIFCRNCWPYLWKTKYEFAKKLSEKTDKNSYLVTGNYDDFHCPMLLKNCFGFSMHKNLLNVLVKSDSNYFDDSRFIFKNKFKDNI